MTTDLVSISDRAFQFSETGLIYVKHTPTFEDWQATWNHLKVIDKATPWIIGDLLIYGEDAYGEQVSQELEASEEDEHSRFTPGSIKQYRYVSRQWPWSSRLNLPWSYHQTVASLPMEQRLALLQHCMDHDIKRAELRILARELNNGKLPNPPTMHDDTIDQLTQDNYQKDKQIAKLEYRLENGSQGQIEAFESESDDTLPTYVYAAVASLKNYLQVDSDDGFESVTIFANGSVMWKARE